MYQEYFKLKEKPFENTPDPRFLYLSRGHEEALTRLDYTVKGRKGAGMLTGEFGSGKTVLCHALLNDLDKNVYKTISITNTQISPIEFLREIIYQLGGNTNSQDKTDLLHMLDDILRRNASINKDTVVVIDEAQLIKDRETFEELRLLLNFQLEDRFLLTLLLIGQPELREKMNRLPQLKQRIVIKHHLNTLDEEETSKYIPHRLRIAGQEDEIFTPPATKLIHHHSGGTPRVINTICDLALLLGFDKKVKAIDEGLIREVITDIGGNW